MKYVLNKSIIFQYAWEEYKLLLRHKGCEKTFSECLKRYYRHAKLISNYPDCNAFKHLFKIK